MDYTKRAVKGAAILLLMYVLAGLFGYFFRMVVARNLDPLQYGLFYAVFSFVMFFGLFSDFGLGSAVVRFIPEFQAKKRFDLIKNSITFTFFIQLMFSTIIALGFFSLSNWLALKYFHNVAAIPVIKIMAFVFWFTTFGVFIASFQGFQKMFEFSLTNFLKMLFAFIFVLMLFSSIKDARAPAYSYAISSILVTLFTLAIFKLKVFPDFFNYKFKINKNLFKTLFRFGISTSLASFSYLILSYTDTIMLTYSKTLNDVAFYNVAMPIATVLVWFVAYPLSTVLLPMTSEMYSRKNLKSLKNGMESVQKYCVLFLIPLAILFITFSEIIIRVLFGEAYVAASIILRILAIGVIFYSLSTINVTALYGIKKPELTAQIISVVALINVILNIALIPKFGTIGAATATSLSYLVMMIWSSFKLKQNIKIKLPFIYLIKVVLLGIFIVALIAFLKNIFVMNYVLEFFLIASIISFVYVFLALLLKLIYAEEVLKLIKSLIK
ncbi:MAG: flippase [Candidatus Omnitrophica bacterium]|nr:flippase [Candidatus Omnitrophota bacterium]